jgi:hypothetical protein
VRRAVPALLLAAVVFGGCGGGDDNSKASTPKAALLGYYDAVGQGDVKKACSFTTGALNASCGHDTAALTKDETGRKVLASNAHTIFGKAKFVERGDLACTGVLKFGFDMKKTGGGWKIMRLRRPLTSKNDCTVGLKG